ncbi:hypothetical protein FOCC_FOCC003031 [Frankliniella occidentalis]|nr:hypothetical protein FOCC_FOCC003031 [Frankliniella occidentalis]
MSTQAYYKDRLGFDPAEAANDGVSFDKNKQGYEENLSKFKGLWDFFIESIGLILVTFSSEWLCNGGLVLVTTGDEAGPAGPRWHGMAYERDAIQKKTFTKWVNKHLKKSYLFLGFAFVSQVDYDRVSRLEIAFSPSGRLVIPLLCSSLLI